MPKNTHRAIRGMCLFKQSRQFSSAKLTRRLMDDEAGDEGNVSYTEDEQAWCGDGL